MNQNLIIDGFNLAFRAFFAFSTLATKMGVQSGCVYGFLCGLRSLKKKHPAFHITVAWDNEAVRKKEIFSDYKAQRPHQHNIIEHIQDLKSILRAMNITQAEKPLEEADDVIASVARKYSSEGLVYIYTSDKDLLQLVRNGKIIVIRPKNGGLPDRYYDEEAVQQEYGVAPEDLACFLTFKGDSSDNIPGAARLPSKVIASLVNQYKTPEAIYLSPALGALTDFQRHSLLTHKAQSQINYSIIRLREDLDCDLVVGIPNVAVVKDFLAKYEIKAIMADSFVEMFNSEGGFSDRFSPSIENYSLF